MPSGRTIKNKSTDSILNQNSSTISFEYLQYGFKWIEKLFCNMLTTNVEKICHITRVVANN